MRSGQIKSALEAKGTNLADLAREVGISQTFMSSVVHRSGKSRRIERAIADKLDMQLYEVFPDRYPMPEGIAPEMLEISTTELKNIKDALAKATGLIDYVVLKHKAL
jgi:Ner family transcriptional regulator